LLQIHDELIFEVAVEQRYDVARLVRRNMEEAIVLSVPLEVTVKSGSNWYAVETLAEAESPRV
ncbi:MAG TPA: DNA polymerase, partial [Candidatus Tumulicola sp.]|nr:DNA polymerase [Candidatus Tumulicola sp.]